MITDQWSIVKWCINWDNLLIVKEISGQVRVGYKRALTIDQYSIASVKEVSTRNISMLLEDIGYWHINIVYFGSNKKIFDMFVLREKNVNRCWKNLNAKKVREKSRYLMKNLDANWVTTSWTVARLLPVMIRSST